MNRLEIGIILGVTWTVFIVIALAWLHAAAEAGDRWDRTMADHHQDKDQ